MSVGDLIRERRAADGRRLTPLQIRLHEEHKARQARLFPFKPKAYCPPPPPANDPAPVIAIAAVEPEPPAFKQPWFTIEEYDSLDVHSIPLIQRIVCKHFGITMAQMLGQRRIAPIVRPRQIAMYLCRVLTERSWPDIGRRFGGRDHTTALAAIKRIEKIMAENPGFAVSVNDLRETVQRLHAEQRARLKAACAPRVDRASNSNSPLTESSEAPMLDADQMEAS